MTNCNSYKDTKPDIDDSILNKILLTVFIIIILSVFITFLI
jgi:hypothetical protein